MIGRQGETWPERAGNTNPATIGAHLLRIALDFDEAIMCGKEVNAVLAGMLALKRYNPVFVEALRRVQVAETLTESRPVTVEQLRPRMILNPDVLRQDGYLLLSKGLEITESAIACLKSCALHTGVAEPIYVSMLREE